MIYLFIAGAVYVTQWIFTKGNQCNYRQGRGEEHVTVICTYLVKIQSTQRPNFKSNKFQTPHLSSKKQEIKLTEDRPWYRTNNLILPVAMGAKTSNLEKLKIYIYI